MSINPAASLQQAIAWVTRERDKGVTCPCCGQFAKTYRRNINAGMARSLISMYVVAMRQTAGAQPNPRDWIHVPTQIGARSREEGKLAYWGLVEEQLTTRPDGGRAGYWRLTEDGVLFVRNQMHVRKYAKVYNGTCLGFEGQPVDIRQALGSRFSYSELMKA